MKEWEKKYAEIEEGEVAWYWHEGRNKGVSVICQVKRVGGHLECEEGLTPVNEDYPNGDRCLTPGEIEGREAEFLRLSNIALEHYRKALYEIIAIGGNYPEVLEMGEVIRCAKKALGE